MRSQIYLFQSSDARALSADIAGCNVPRGCYAASDCRKQLPSDVDAIVEHLKTQGFSIMKSKRRRDNGTVGHGRTAGSGDAAVSPLLIMTAELRGMRKLLFTPFARRLSFIFCSTI